ncbi:MAG: hypothetical protein RI936_605, partial [Pseudomonadota bacterium]
MAVPDGRPGGATSPALELSGVAIT